jgi:hypothetical protein
MALSLELSLFRLDGALEFRQLLFSGQLELLPLLLQVLLISREVALQLRLLSSMRKL